MAEIKLKAQNRELVGRKVKKIRREGMIPANVYGKKIKSLAVSLERKEFEKVYYEVGETGVVRLKVEGEKEERPILLQNVQTDPVTDEILHVDLRQIILTEKVAARIPLELVGRAPATEQKIGILIQPVSEVEVEALPMDLPEKFEVDISKLGKVGDEVKVKDLTVDKKKITLKTDDNLVVVKIEPLAEEEKVEVPPVEVPPAGEAVPPAEGEEKPAEQVPSEEKKEEEKKE